MIKSLKSKIERSLLQYLGSRAGKASAQPFFENLHRAALHGMNFGNGGEVHESGELFTMRFVAATLASDAIVFDVGANVGQWVTEFARIMPNAAIHSFEPSQTTFKKLLSNTKGINITPHQVGMGEEEGTVSLFSSSVTSELSSLYQRNLSHINIVMEPAETIRITTLDRFTVQHQIPRIDFLKLDVEGHELSVLKGATNLIAENNIRYIQFEFGGTSIDSKVFFQDFWHLLTPKYNIYRILKDGFRPIHEYSVSHEIFNTINYLAILH